MIKTEYHSDKRVKGGIFDDCKLCGKLTTLRLSHIAPKWMYSYLKSESEKGHIIGVYPSLDSNKIIHQDGSKHYLLCDECEQFLGESENYIKLLMTKKTTDVNAELIQRFVIGLAYKSHFATSAPFHSINIKKKYLEFIRESLIKKEFRSKNFFITATEFYDNQEINSKALIVPGWNSYQNGTYAFTLLGGGWEWMLLINKNNKFNDFPEYNYIKSYRLEESKNFPILSGKITDHRFVIDKSK